MSKERISPMHMLGHCLEITAKLRGDIGRKCEMLLEELFERLLKQDKEKPNGHKK
tara:strand:- start:194 stop:358 length:165 start_codon:yes stop_codon:yes gene_type:complete